MFHRNSEFSQDINAIMLSFNVSMAITEKVTDKIMKNVINIEEMSNSSSVLSLNLAMLLPDHPLTVEYVLTGKNKTGKLF